MSLMTNEAHSILTCLLGIWISSLGKCLFKSPTTFLSWVVGLFHIDLWEFIIDIRVLSVICFANFPSPLPHPSETYLFTIWWSMISSSKLWLTCQFWPTIYFCIWSLTFYLLISMNILSWPLYTCRIEWLRRRQYCCNNWSITENMSIPRLWLLSKLH